MTIRRRLNLYYVGTLLGLVLVAVVVIGIALVGAVTEGVRETARASALTVARSLEGGAAPDADVLRSVDDGNVLVVVRDDSGVVLVETDHPVAGIGDDERAGGTDVWREALAAGEAVTSDVKEAHVYALPVSPPGGPGMVVETWASYDARGESSLPVGKRIVFVFAALVVAGLIGGFLHVRGALKPVEALARSAETISASDLSRRLPDRGTRDELDRLAEAFNGVLDRLETSFAEREEALARQRRFTADASHELRTPLASIIGYARMLRTWGLTDPATAAEGVAMIERETGRLISLTERLLALARADEGGAPPRRERLDLGALVAEEVAVVRAAGADGPPVELAVPGVTLAVETDPAGLRRALGAVLENAVRFTPSSGTVRVAILRRAGDAVIEVADTGPGIPVEHQPHVFDRFYQVDPSRATAGSGLGLALARTALERAGGRIELESEAGNGATFRLVLPAVG